MWAARRGDNIAVNLLIEAGVDVNKSNNNGITALFLAIQSVDLRCARSLLAAGADSSATTLEGLNALHWAALYQNKRDIVKSLQETGTNVNGRNIWGGVPLCYSVIGHHAVSAKALVDYGADINAADSEGDTSLCDSLHYHADDVLQLLLFRGASYTTIYSFGRSLLHIAAVSGGLKTLRILLAAKLKNVDTELLSSEGKTALQLTQERIDKPDGFLEKFEELLADIRDRTASVTGEESDRTNVDVRAIHKLLNHLKRLQSLRIQLINMTTSVLARVTHLQRRANRFFISLTPSPSWESFWIHWAMGICSTGLFYIFWRFFWGHSV